MARTASSRAKEIRAALQAELGDGAVLPGDTTGYLEDATEGRGVRGVADAVVLAGSTEELARALSWCYSNDVAVIPRGGGTGYAGGAVPLHGGVVLGLERMTAVREFEPERWRICVEAGVRTADVRRMARENGLFFPPDPGAAEQSQIGGNIATNAGGPHAFKYGVTGHWVSGLEAVVPPGEVIEVGGPVRKDVAGYDLRGLLVGSEGTLGIVTAAWLKLLPAPEAVLPVVALYKDVEQGCAAIERVMASGVEASVLDYLDGATLAAAGDSFPEPLPGEAPFMVLSEADGSALEAERVCEELIGALEAGSVQLYAPRTRAEIDGLWRWRDGVSVAVSAKHGGKVSEDIVVPVERLAEAIERTLEIGAREGLEPCSWGHAGDGNLHSTFMLDPRDPEQLERGERAAEELFQLAVELGGSISGEHGVGWTKAGRLGLQWAPRALELHAGLKRSFDPKGLLNPGKKLARMG